MNLWFGRMKAVHVLSEAVHLLVHDHREEDLAADEFLFELSARSTDNKAKYVYVYEYEYEYAYVRATMSEILCVMRRF